MSQLPDIHLCIVQPLGYVHSLGFIDPARYFRHQFRRFGARVSMAKNRLRHDAVNFVFGAHLGFDPAQRERHACVFVNLEQLGKGGAKVSQAYLDLLASSAVVDYDADNVAAYAKDADTVPVVPMLYAPYLADAAAMPLAQRPIDLLFIGSMNPRRRALIDRIEAQGVQVAMFDSALYGEERDHFITQAKAVLNMHFYDSSRFEQVRVSHCLSLGTPVISERGAACRPHAGIRRLRALVRRALAGTRVGRIQERGFRRPLASRTRAVSRRRPGRGLRRPARVRRRLRPRAPRAQAAGPVAADAHPHRLGQGLQARLAQRRRAGARRARPGARPVATAAAAAGRRRGHGGCGGTEPKARST